MEIEFEIGDKIYWKPRYKTYLVTEKNTERYTLKREYDEKNILVNLDIEDQGVASGQFMVFYNDMNKVIGSGIMELTH